RKCLGISYHLSIPVSNRTPHPGPLPVEGKGGRLARAVTMRRVVFSLSPQPDHVPQLLCWTPPGSWVHFWGGDCLWARIQSRTDCAAQRARRCAVETRSVSRAVPVVGLERPLRRLADDQRPYRLEAAAEPRPAGFAQASQDGWQEG